MARIYEYPYNGKEYHKILSLSYFNAYRYTESEMLEICSLERSIFYERRKEATYLLGIALWGYAIPEVQNIFSELSERLRDETNATNTGFMGILN